MKIFKMLFSSNFPEEIRKEGKRFLMANIISIPSKIVGVYVLHYKLAFVYVGQSRQQGLKERLLQHYNGSHNTKLSIWVNAIDGDIQFTCLPCVEDKIDDLERSLIHFLQPATNVNRYDGYIPKTIHWRTTHE